MSDWKERHNLAVLLAFLLGVALTVVILIPIGQSGGDKAWGDIPTWVQALAVVVGLGYVASQLREARAVRAEQNRPYVVVSADRLRGAMWTLRLENVSRTPAWDVRVTFDPPLVGSFDDEMRDNVGYGLGDMSIFVTGVRLLPPHYRLETILDHFGHREEKGLPFRYEVQVSYHDGRGRSFEDPPSSSTSRRWPRSWCWTMTLPCCGKRSNGSPEAPRPEASGLRNVAVAASPHAPGISRGAWSSRRKGSSEPSHGRVSVNEENHYVRTCLRSNPRYPVC